MKNLTFGDLTFSIGWRTSTNIMLFDKPVSITVKIKAFYEKDRITTEQEKAIADFDANKEHRIATVEKLLNGYSNGNATERFKAKTLLFERNGAYALLCDDSENEDGGVAACLAPTEMVVSQDEYL